MDFPGSNYLFALAATSIAFVGFSAIVVVLRQALGAELSSAQLVLIRFFIDTGFALTVFALLPSLLVLLGLPLATVWRVAGLGFTLFFVAYTVANAVRRRRVGLPADWFFWGMHALSAVILLYLLVNLSGLVSEPSVGPYALALTWRLLQLFLTFIQRLDIFLKPR